MSTMRRAACTRVLLFLLSCCSGFAGGLESQEDPPYDSSLAEALSRYAQGLCYLDEAHAPTGAATAVSFFRQAAELDPDSRDIHDKLVETLDALGDARGALDAQRGFARRQSEIPAAWSQLCRLAVKAGDSEAFAEGIAALRKLPTPAPANQRGKVDPRLQVDFQEVAGWVALGRAESALNAFRRLLAERRADGAVAQDVLRPAAAFVVALADRREAVAVASPDLLPAMADMLAEAVADREFAAGFRLALAMRYAQNRGAAPATTSRLAERALLADPSHFDLVMPIVFPAADDLKGLDAAAIAAKIGRHPRPDALAYPFSLMRLNYLIDARDAAGAMSEYALAQTLLAEGRGGAVDSPVRAVLGAAALDLSGDAAAAIALLEQTLALHPDSAMVQNSLAYTLALQGRDLDRALDLVDRALKAEPDNCAYLDTLGWILFKRGDHAGALRSLVSAVERETHPSWEVYDHVGDVLVKLGRSAEAPAWWAKSYRLQTVESVGEKLRQAGIDPASLREP